jgi:hypothetical protein
LLVQTSQLHATTGTPVEVPVPRKVTFILLLSFGTVEVNNYWLMVNG